MSQVKIKSALHTAINAMPGLVPASVVSAFNGQVVTTQQPHGLVNGAIVVASGSNFDGAYGINVLSANSFTLRDLITGASVMKPAGGAGVVTPQLTAWPNVTFDPVMELPWQKVNVVFGKPEEPTAGSDFYREVGFLQVTLYYPLLQGDGPATSRAELIRTTFRKGKSVTKDNVTVQFSSVAQIMEGVPTDEQYIVIVRAPFYANIYL